MTKAQQKYPTIEQELLAIVELLKEFRNILLGQSIIIHTNHQNLIHNSFTSDRVMRWRLYLEEYSLEIRYIKGESNQVADNLPRLPKILNTLTVIDAPNTMEQMNIKEISDLFCYKLEKT